MAGMDIPVVARITAFGHRYGEPFLAPDTDRTWRLVGVGLWDLNDDPAWWPDMSTTVDADGGTDAVLR
jgi:hypothetical protein